MLRLMSRLAKILEPFDRELLARRRLTLPKVPGVRQVYMAFCVELMQWSDKGLPQHRPEVFPPAGELQESGVLLPTLPKNPGKGVAPGDSQVLLGQSAVECVDSLEADHRPPTNAEEIWQAAQDEVQEGTAEPLRTREAMDEHFGAGKWRPLPRHVIWHSTKWRPIDEGKRSGINSMNTIEETIVCVAPGFA